MIDSIIPVILTFKEYSKRVQYVSNTCWTYFEHSFNVNISGMKLPITSPFSVQIMSYFGASDRPIKKNGELFDLPYISENSYSKKKLLNEILNPNVKLVQNI